MRASRALQVTQRPRGKEPTAAGLGREQGRDEREEGYHTQCLPRVIPEKGRREWRMTQT